MISGESLSLQNHNRVPQDRREKITSIQPCMTGRTGGEEWDSIPVSKDSEDSQLRLENSMAPKLIPLTVLLGNWSGKTPLGLMTQLCLLAGWFAAESYYVALV